MRRRRARCGRAVVTIFLIRTALESRVSTHTWTCHDTHWTHRAHSSTLHTGGGQSSRSMPGVCTWVTAVQTRKMASVFNREVQHAMRWEYMPIPYTLYG
jgi:hypothetical protein